MFQSSPINFLDLCNKLEAQAQGQNQCASEFYTQLLRFLKSRVYVRGSICAKISDALKGQACFDDTAVDVLRFVPTLDQLTTDLSKKRCGDDLFWRLVAKLEMWNDLSAFEKSIDLRQFVAAPIPAFASLGEVVAVSAPVIAPAVSAAIPVPPPMKN